MASSPAAPDPKQNRLHVLGRGRTITLIVLGALFIVCLAFSWNTSIPLSGVNWGKGPVRPGQRRTLVDLSPWQAAQTLSALAVTAEESEYARDALRLADHEVDQAFALALRQAALQSTHRPKTAEVQTAQQKVGQLQDLVTQDQTIVQALSAALAPKPNGKTAAQPDPDISNDLEVAKAQLSLDTDELADAQHELDYASGDNSVQIKAELAAHQAAQKQFEDAARGSTEVAAVSVRRRGTLMGRLSGWFGQMDRNRSIVQAQRDTLADAAALTREQGALKAKFDAAATASNQSSDHAARLADIRDRSTERQILNIYDDRIQTAQQLAAVYGKWSAQVQLQHGIVGRLILQSFSIVLLIAMGTLLCDALMRQIMDRVVLERRQMHTLRSVLSLTIQVIGVGLVLLIFFGPPQETPTILGLATAALTIALQDFILAFLGWFVLMGKNGIHVGDWVEINGVGGEVSEVGLFSTTLLETGTLEDKGYPTGRRITFMNSFAIRGQYFNFSTSGQWMWDEISVTIPAGGDTSAIVEKIHQTVLAATEENSRLAEQEWKRGTRSQGLRRFSAEPVVNLRPSAAGIDTQVRYVTRASERFDLRNRLYQRIVELLQHPAAAAPASA